MGTDLLLQLLAESAAPIKEDVASTARVQAITQSFELVFVEIYSAAADRTRLGCRYDSWRSPTCLATLFCGRVDCVITSVVDVLARKESSKKPWSAQSHSHVAAGGPHSLLSQGLKDLVLFGAASSRKKRSSSLAQHKQLSPLAVVVGLFGAVRYSVGQLTAPRDVDAPLNRHIVARP